MKYSVAKLARLSGVTRRTLHHYDKLGLLVPDRNEDNKYRVYSEETLERLQLILIFKELDFGLEEIKKLLERKMKPVEMLQEQVGLIEMKKVRLERILSRLKATITNLKNGGKMKTDDLQAVFDQAHIDQHKDEVIERWGNTQAYKQSTEALKKMSKEEIKGLTADWDKVGNRLAETMDQGVESADFQEAIASLHKMIGRFYECSPEMLRGLGQMYVTDPRFREFYDKRKVGLAEAVNKGIEHYLKVS